MILHSELTNLNDEKIQEEIYFRCRKQMPNKYKLFLQSFYRSEVKNQTVHHKSDPDAHY